MISLWALILAVGWGGGFGSCGSITPTPASGTPCIVLDGLSAYSSAVVQDSLMYVASGSNLKIYNIADYYNPVLRSTTAASIQGYGGKKIAIKNKLLYSLSPMKVWNVSNPASVSLLSTASPGAGNQSIAVSGNTAYTTYQDGQTGYVTSFDVTDSTAAAKSDTFNHGTSYPKGLTVGGNYLYVAWHSVGTKVFDISNPAAITLTATIARSSFDYHEYCLWDSNYLYILTGVDSSYLRIYDVTTPATPSLVGKCALPNGLNSGNNGLALAKSGKYVWTSSFATADSTWNVIDVTDKANPVVTKTVYTKGMTSWIVPLNGYYYTLTNGNCILYKE
jgi:hypothetical protein